MARFSLAAATLLASTLLQTRVQAWTPTTRSRRNGLVLSNSAITTRSLPSITTLHSSTTASTTADDTQLQQQLVLYNSASRQKEIFQTLEPNKVKMYTCGPTVYDSAHVGNFRAFLTYDVLKRVLLYLGYDVNHVCNLTDVDDKIIQRCQERGTTCADLTSMYEAAFMDDLQALNIMPATHYPRATNHINDMVQLVLSLKAKDLAYQSPDGSWYFATQNQPSYGTHLVNLKVDEMISQDRTAQQNDVKKKHAQDFCLWKAYKPGVDMEEATWDTEIGRGRPGWHLECSAMAKRFLGDTIDVHCGGIDLKFPHHENEIAQSEGSSGKVFCNCWLHNGFVNIGDEKMSKSLGNFLTLRAACPKSTNVRAYRYLVVSSQYRNPLSFTQQAMNGAKQALKRMDKCKAELEQAIKDDNNGNSSGESELATTVVPAQLANFEAALLDDLSMPRAAASLFALVKAAETEFKRHKKDSDSKLDVVGLQAILDGMLQMDKVFGIFYQVPMSKEQEEEAPTEVPTEVLDLVGQRTAAKEAKDWDLADSLRARITELGYKIKDVKGGGEPIVSPLD